MAYSQASQSQYSLYAESDIQLNSDLLLQPDDFPSLSYNQPTTSEPATDWSKSSETTAPPSLLRVGPYLQRYWVLFSADPAMEIDTSRKDFVKWWLNTDFGSRPSVKASVTWEGKKKSEVWDHFHQVAHERTGEPKVMCKNCFCTLVHPQYQRAGSSPMKGHLKTTSCRSKPVSGKRIDQLIQQMVS